jgi:hypothetical protein
MIKSLMNGKNGAKIVMLGISEENVKRMKAGDPMYLHLDELGIEGIDVLIHYGTTEEAIITDLQDKGLIPDDKV